MMVNGNVGLFPMIIICVVCFHCLLFLIGSAIIVECKACSEIDTKNKSFAFMR